MGFGVGWLEKESEFFFIEFGVALDFSLLMKLEKISFSLLISEKEKTPIRSLPSFFFNFDGLLQLSDLIWKWKTKKESQEKKKKKETTDQMVNCSWPRGCKQTIQSINSYPLVSNMVLIYISNCSLSSG